MDKSFGSDSRHSGWSATPAVHTSTNCMIADNWRPGCAAVWKRVFITFSMSLTVFMHPAVLTHYAQPDTINSDVTGTP